MAADGCSPSPSCDLGKTWCEDKDSSQKIYETGGGVAAPRAPPGYFLGTLAALAKIYQKRTWGNETKHKSAVHMMPVL